MMWNWSDAAGVATQAWVVTAGGLRLTPLAGWSDGSATVLVFFLLLVGSLCWSLFKLVHWLAFGPEDRRDPPGGKAPPHPSAPPRCGDCDLRLVSADSICPRCGARGESPLSNVVPSARILRRWHRHTTWLRDRGLLLPEVAQRLLATFEAELSILQVAPPGTEVTPTDVALPRTAAISTGHPPAEVGPERPTVLTTAVPNLAPLPGSRSSTTPDATERDGRPDLATPPAVTSDEPLPTGVTRAAGPTGETDRGLSVRTARQPAATPVQSPGEEPLWLEFEPSAESVSAAGSPLTTTSPTTVTPSASTSAATSPGTAVVQPAWSEWFLAFMEQRNLNWGELIGGLMILSGSIALVLSFWNEIASRPVLKFCVFNGFTAALFAAGRYALARLQLPSTARALYAIGTLLVPLNLLALAAFTRGGAVLDPLLVVGELGSIALFAWLTTRAGRVLSSDAPTHLAWGVVGPAVASLIIARCQIADGPLWLSLALGIWPVALYLAANLAPWSVASQPTSTPSTDIIDTHSTHPAGDLPTMTSDRSGDPRTSLPSSSAWWRLLTTSFATLLPLGLLLVRGTTPQARTLAPLLPLLAAPSLSLALASVSRRSERESEWSWLWTAVAGFPALILLVGSLLLSWPTVWPCLLTIGTLTGVLAWISARARSPGLWLGALPGVLLGWLLVLGLLRGQVAWNTTDAELLGGVLWHPWNGLLMLPLAALLGAGSRSRSSAPPELARWLQIAAGVLCLCSLLHASGTSLGRAGDPGWGSLVFLLLGWGAWQATEWMVSNSTPPLAGTAPQSPMPVSTDEVAGPPSPGTEDLSHSRVATAPPARALTGRVSRQASPAGLPNRARVRAAGDNSDRGLPVWLGLGLASVVLLVVGSGQLVLARWPALFPPPGPLVPLLAAGFLLVAPPWRRTRVLTASPFDPTRSPGELRVVAVAGLSIVALLIGWFTWWLRSAERAPLQGLPTQIWLCVGVWLVLAWTLRRLPRLGGLAFGAAQLLMALASGLSVAQQLTPRGASGDLRPELFDLRIWQWTGLVVSLECLCWLVLRRWSTAPTIPFGAASEAPSSAPRTLTAPSLLTALRRDLGGLWHGPQGIGDRWLVGGLVASLLLVAGYAVFPGAARELTPRQQAEAWSLSLAASGTADRPPVTGQAHPAEGGPVEGAPAGGAGPAPTVTTPVRFVPPLSVYEIPGLPHSRAAETGTWCWWGALLVLMVGWQLHEPTRLRSFLGLTVFATATLLLASRWELEVASASALRWWLTGLMCLTAGLAWTLQAWRPRLADHSPAPSSSLSLAGRCLQPFAEELVDLSMLFQLLCLVGGALLAGGMLVATPTLSLISPQEWTLTLACALLGLIMGLVIYSLSDPAPAVPAGATDVGERTPHDRSLWAGLAAGLGVCPLVVVLLFGVAQALRGNPLLGPEPGSLFQRLGPALNHAIPLAVWGVVLTGQAFVFRRPTLLFLAGLLFQSATTLAVLFAATRAGRTLDRALWTELLLWNSLVASLVAVGWWWQRSWLEGVKGDPPGVLPGRPHTPSVLLRMQLLLGPLLWGLVWIPVVPEVWLTQWAGPATGQLTSGLGLLAGAALTLALTVGAKHDTRVNRWPIWRALITASGAGMLWSLITRLPTRWSDPVNHWQCLGLVLTVATVALWIIEWRIACRETPTGDDAGSSAGSGPVVLGGLAALVALWHGQPGCAWPNAVMVWTLGCLCLAQAAWRGTRPWSWGAVGLWCLGQTLMESFTRQLPLRDLLVVGSPTSLLSRLLLVAALPAALSIAVRHRSPADGQTLPPTRDWLTDLLREPARVVGSVGLLLVLLNITNDLWWWSDPGAEPGAFARLALPVAMLAVWTATLFDGTAFRSVPPIHLAAWAIVLQLAVSPVDSLTQTLFRLFPWQAMLTGFTGLLWVRRADLQTVTRWLGVNAVSRDGERNRLWLRQATGCISLLILPLAVWQVAFAPVRVTTTLLDRGLMLGIPVSAVVAVGVLALLCRPTDDLTLRGRVLRRGMWVAMVTGWAIAGASDLAQTGGAFTLFWTIIPATLTLYQAALVVSTRQCTGSWAEWRVAAGRLLGWLPWVSGGLHLLLVALHPGGWGPHGLARDWATGLMLGSLLLMMGGVISVAVRPDLSPGALTEVQRRRLVFLGEVFLGLFFWQFRRSFPELFHGLEAYWPVLVVALAFAGLGVAELFRRRNQPVLAEPVEQTALGLPLLPLLGYWLSPSTSVAGAGLLLGGLLYGILSQRRGSLWMALATLVTLTGAVWVPLSEWEAGSFFRHPQLWLIPPAVGLLLTAWLHRDRLTATQSGTLRNVGAITIYLSSTCDMFLNGLAREPWLVLVLCGLSVAGMLLGMQLRVRGFLFLGFGFLLLSLVSMVWHAAVNLHQTWTVWLAVVLLGVAVLGLFALVERRRSQIEGLLRDLRDWSV